MSQEIRKVVQIKTQARGGEVLLAIKFEDGSTLTIPLEPDQAGRLSRGLAQAKEYVEGFTGTVH